MSALFCVAWALNASARGVTFNTRSAGKATVGVVEKVQA